MRLLAFLLLLPLLASATAQPAGNPPSTLNVMPLPAYVIVSPGKLRFDASFTVAVNGYSDSRLEQGIFRMQERLRRRTGLVLPLGAKVGADQSGTLRVSVRDGAPRYPKFGEDESYALVIDGANATLQANTTVGALRGLDTLSQLVAGDASGYYFPLVNIQDKPRFAWRGLMIDVGRHFEPIGVIERTLDGMAAVKLNVFHWHLSDDQGFRVESKKFPDAAGVGSDGQYYTQDQMREVIAYARDRGIRVVPEFDMPGHTTAWLRRLSRTGSGPGPYQRSSRHGASSTPRSTPRNEKTYKFLDGFIGEMAELFPDEYFHIGGDEINGKGWLENPRIQAFMKENDFTQARPSCRPTSTSACCRSCKHGKKMMGWDEILTPDLPKDIVVQSWRGQQSLAQAARQGYIGILSAGYYLDLMQPAAQHYRGILWSATALTPEQKSHILGGEACMWVEFATPESVDTRIWPRMAAIAERLWSPEDVKDVARCTAASTSSASGSSSTDMQRLLPAPTACCSRSRAPKTWDRSPLSV